MALPRALLLAGILQVAVQATTIVKLKKHMGYDQGRYLTAHGNVYLERDGSSSWALVHSRDDSEVEWELEYEGSQVRLKKHKGSNAGFYLTAHAQAYRGRDADSSWALVHVDKNVDSLWDMEGTQPLVRFKKHTNMDAGRFLTAHGAQPDPVGGYRDDESNWALVHNNNDNDAIWEMIIVQEPTSAPTPMPTSAPTRPPTSAPTPTPTHAPSSSPTPAPTTVEPTASPTPAPTEAPTSAPSSAPTEAPTSAPTQATTGSSTSMPTPAPETAEPAPTPTPTAATSQLASPAPTPLPQAPTPTPPAAPTSSLDSTPTPTLSPPPTTAAPTPAPPDPLNDMEQGLLSELIAELNSTGVTGPKVDISDSATVVVEVINVSEGEPAALDVNGTGAMVNLPASLLNDFSGDTVALVASVIKAPLSILPPESSPTFISDSSVSFLSVNIASLTSGKNLDISELSDDKKITISIPVQGVDDNATCIYWDENARQWSSDGLEQESYENGVVTCQTSHLTIFGGFAKAFRCTNHLLTKDSYEELMDSKWAHQPWTWLLWILLAVLLGILLLALALDVRDHRLGLAWDPELFLIPESEVPTEEEEACSHVADVKRQVAFAICLASVCSAVRDLLDEVGGKMFAHFGHVRGMLEVVWESLQEALEGGTFMEMAAAGVLARSTARHASASLYMHQDDVAFLTDEGMLEELAALDEEAEGRLPADSGEDIVWDCDGTSSRIASFDSIRSGGGDVQVLPGTSASGTSPDDVEMAASYALPEVSASGTSSGEVEVGKTATIAQLAKGGNRAARLRFEKLTQLRAQLRKRSENSSTLHANWCSLPRLMVSSFLLHGPLGSVFSRSILMSRAMRALLFVCEVLGTLLMATLFFTSDSNRPITKRNRSSNDCGNDLSPEQEVGRLLFIGVASAVIAGIPIALMGSLHGRSIKKVRYVGCGEWSRQLRAWRIQDASIWVIGLAYSMFAINYVALLFANIANREDDVRSWFKGAAIGFLEDLVAAPIIVALIMPLLCIALLARVSCRHQVNRCELAVPGKISTLVQARGQTDRPGAQVDVASVATGSTAVDVRNELSGSTLLERRHSGGTSQDRIHKIA